MIASIREFANAMNIELNCNEHKGDWQDITDFNTLILELNYHQAKLMMAIRDRDSTKIKEYSADCANYLMMMYHLPDKSFPSLDDSLGRSFF